MTTIEKRNSYDKYLERFELWKVERIPASINPFTNKGISFINRRKKIELRENNSEELRNLRETDIFKNDVDVNTLNLEQSEEGIYICKGLIEGVYPIYIAKESLTEEKVIFANRKKC